MTTSAWGREDGKRQIEEGKVGKRAWERAREVGKKVAQRGKAGTKFAWRLRESEGKETV